MIPLRSVLPAVGHGIGTSGRFLGRAAVNTGRVLAHPVAGPIAASYAGAFAGDMTTPAGQRSNANAGGLIGGLTGLALTNPRATLRGAAATGRFLGRTAATTSRTLAQPLARSVAGSGAGFGAGYTYGLANNQNPWMTGAAGATMGLGAVNPRQAVNFVRNQVRYAARAGEPAARPSILNAWLGGRTPSVVGSTANLLFRPRYPIIEPALTRLMPRWGPRIAGTARALPVVATGLGAGMGAYHAQRAIPDQMTYAIARDELGIDDEATLNRIWWDTWRSQPSMLNRMYGFNRDNTSVGDTMRTFVPNLLRRGLLHAPANARNRMPGFMAVTDRLRQTTPYGNATVWGVNNLLPQNPVLPHGAMAETLHQRQGDLASDPHLLDSPLLQMYANILTQPDVQAHFARRPVFTGEAGQGQRDVSHPEQAFMNWAPTQNDAAADRLTQEQQQYIHQNSPIGPQLISGPQAGQPGYQPTLGPGTQAALGHYGPGTIPPAIRVLRDALGLSPSMTVPYTGIATQPYTSGAAQAAINSPQGQETRSTAVGNIANVFEQYQRDFDAAHQSGR